MSGYQPPERADDGDSDAPSSDSKLPLCDSSSSLEDDPSRSPYNASSSDSDDANLAEWMARHTLGAPSARGDAVEATHNGLLRRSPAPGTTPLSSSSAADGSWRPDFGSRGQREEPGAPIAKGKAKSKATGSANGKRKAKAKPKPPAYPGDITVNDSPTF